MLQNVTCSENEEFSSPQDEQYYTDLCDEKEGLYEQRKSGLLYLFYGLGVCLLGIMWEALSNLPQI